MPNMNRNDRVLPKSEHGKTIVGETVDLTQ